MCWVDAMEFDAGLRGGEAPVHRRLRLVALLLPGRDLAGQGRAVADAPVQALAAQDRQLDLGLIEPTAMPGRVMELQLAPDSPRLGGREGLVERRAGMRAQVV